MKHKTKITKLISHKKVSKEKQTGDREEEAQDPERYWGGQRINGQKLILPGCLFGKYGTKIANNSNKVSDGEVLFPVLDPCTDFLLIPAQLCWACDDTV